MIAWDLVHGFADEFTSFEVGGVLILSSAVDDVPEVEDHVGLDIAHFCGEFEPLIGGMVGVLHAEMGVGYDEE